MDDGKAAAMVPGDTPLPRTKAQRDKALRRERRLARDHDVLRLQAQGLPLRAIGRQLGLSLKTVRRFVRAGQFPEVAPRRVRSPRLEPCTAYLCERLEAGCRTAARLWREVREGGFRGASRTVRLCVARWRQRGAEQPPNGAGGPVPVLARHVPAPRQGVWLLLGPEETQRAEERAWRNKLTEVCPEIAMAVQQARALQQMVRERAAGRLAGWMESACHRCPERKSFVTGLKQDLLAVEAA